MPGPASMHKKFNPYAERAVLKFKREFFHQERNLLAAGKLGNPEDSATIAMWKTREEITQLILMDPDLDQNIDKEETWAEALYWVMFFRQMMVDLKELEPTVAPTRHHDQIKNGITNSKALAEAIENGAKARVDQKEGVKDEPSR